MARPGGDPSFQACRCGHAHLAHEHYRRGTDCALCVCVQFKAAPAVAAPGRARLFRRRDVRGAAF